MKLNTEPKPYIIYTGIKGRYAYENMLHEEFYKRYSNHGMFYKLYKKAKNKKLLNTFVKPFINRNPKNKFKLVKDRVPSLATVLLRNPDKILPVIHTIGYSTTDNILLSVLDKGKPDKEDIMYDWTLDLKPNAKVFNNGK